MIVFTGKRSGLESGAVRVGRNARVVVQEQAEIPRRGRAQSSDQIFARKWSPAPLRRRHSP